jgi:hypothetical protein
MEARRFTLLRAALRSRRSHRSMKHVYCGPLQRSRDGQEQGQETRDHNHREVDGPPQARLHPVYILVRLHLHLMNRARRQHFRHSPRTVHLCASGVHILQANWCSKRNLQHQPFMYLFAALYLFSYQGIILYAIVRPRVNSEEPELDSERLTGCNFGFSESCTLNLQKIF